MRRLLRAVDAHWFSPASRRDLGIVRIVVVAAQLCFLLLGERLLFGRFGSMLERQLRFANAPDDLFSPLPALKVLMLPLGEWGLRPDPTLVHAVWISAVVCAVFALVGRYSRPSLLGLAVASTFLVAHEYSYGELHHTEALLNIMLWVLAAGPRSAWSLDDLRDRVRLAVGRMRFTPGTPADEYGPYARWPMRLGQWLLALALLSAGISKLTNGGLDWLNGHSLTYFVLKDGILHDRPLGVWLAGHPLLAQGLSFVTLAFELTFVVAVLVPSVAWLYVLVGWALHIGIELTQAAPFFLFMAVYVVFIEPVRASARRALGALGTGRSRSPRASYTLIYDGLCPLCTRTMVVLDYLDSGRRLRYVDFEHDLDAATEAVPDLTPERARRAMHLVTPAGRVRRGFDAFRVLTRVLPPLWPLAPLMHLPPVPRVGRWVYDQVSRRRARAVCRVETCAVDGAGVAVAGDAAPRPSEAAVAASSRPRDTRREGSDHA